MASVRKNHTKEFKAKVALEAIRQQKTSNELTAEYSIHVTACGQDKGSSPYQLVTTKGGKTLRLNSQTGEVHLVTEKGLVHLNDKTPVLEVGEYYQLVDAKTEEKYVKYLGEGRFERVLGQSRRLRTRCSLTSRCTRRFALSRSGAGGAPALGFPSDRDAV